MIKTHWTCMAFVRGKAKPGCQQRIEAGPLDIKVLKKAGWKARVCGRKIRMVCGPCSVLSDHKVAF